MRCGRLASRRSTTDTELVKKITTTAHALLGLIAMRATSTYELAQWMRLSNLRAFWPRAESQVYEEPKKLALAGLAEADTQFVGERKRTVYRVTERGRDALREWLARPSDRFRYRYEAMVKVSFANYGRLGDLRRIIREVREEAEADAREMLEVARNRSPGGSPAPEREHVNALADSFILDIIAARLRWAREAEQLVESWRSVRVDAHSREQADELWRGFEARLEELLDERA